MLLIDKDGVYWREKRKKKKKKKKKYLNDDEEDKYKNQISKMIIKNFLHLIVVGQTIQI